MAFTQSDLKTSIHNLLSTQSIPNTMEQHCIDLAKLYDDYAKDVKESIGLNTLALTGKSSFEITMKTYMLNIPDLLVYSQTIESACISYWTSSVFTLTNVPSIPKVPLTWDSLISISITPMTVGSISSSLNTIFISAKGDIDIISESMSSLLHTVTNTVSMTLTGTSLGSPITISSNLM